MRFWLIVLALGVWLGACGDGMPVGDGDAGPRVELDASDPVDAAVAVDAALTVDAALADDAGASPRLLLALGTDVPAGVAARVEAHLRAVSSLPVFVTRDAGAPPAGSYVLALGDHPLARAVIGAADLAPLGPEGFIVRSRVADGVTTLAASGNAFDGAPADSDAARGLGTGFAAYAALTELGFGFLHPLAALRPSGLPTTWPTVERVESRHLRIRGLQLHTMHPLELTDLLNGWGPMGTADRAGWEAMLPEWDSYLEWMLAQRQNHVHWVLLHGERWADFADGDERRDRLAILVEHAHRFGVMAGVDVPIALHQQHAYRLIRTQGDRNAELAELRMHVDHLMSAGFDYLATESGNSEFTSPDAGQMLAWMNELARHLDEAHGHRPAYIKAHVSSGQTAAGYTDPDTGAPLNFNMLPHYADERLGVMPHTVQHYALDDRAPTYGNANFDYMRTFLQQESGLRTTIWHPETAYWVSFDVDVPLFLPTYFERRFHDLWLLEDDRRHGRLGRGSHAGADFDGQIVFSSGWEWGYWLNDVVTARAAWQLPEAPTERLSLRALLLDVLRVFGDETPAMVDALLALTDHQQTLLTEGDAGSGRAIDIVRRSGIAYLQGIDAWDDVADAAAVIPGVPHIAHQPDKLGLVEMRNPLHSPPGYSAEVEPLLAAMETRFDADADELEAIRGRLRSPALIDLADELAIGARVLALRAQQVHGLYDYVDMFYSTDRTRRAARLASARSALDDAQALVQLQEGHYRVPADRIAGWREGPTAYSYGYLWTARSLHYWWRDEGKAVDLPNSPCYLNIVNGIDVGFGEGVFADVGDYAFGWGESVWGVSGITACLGVPPSEPTYPPSGLRTRP